MEMVFSSQLKSDVLWIWTSFVEERSTVRVPARISTHSPAGMGLLLDNVVKNVVPVGMN